jgi:hypothetical protein
MDFGLEILELTFSDLYIYNAANSSICGIIVF